MEILYLLYVEDINVTHDGVKKYGIMKFDKTKILKKATYPVVTVVLIAGAAWGYLAAKNASLKATAYTPGSEEIARLENKIAHLEHDFKTHVQNDAPITVADISALNEKFNNLNKINAEILDSKASLSAVMGLIGLFHPMKSLTATKAPEDAE